MRLLLTLQHQPNQVLPINYSWLTSSWIYRTLEQADPAFSDWLHNRGFGFNGKQYKLFTFSPLQPKWYQIDKREQTFILAQSPTTLTLSFYVEEAVQHFVIGLFKNQRFSLKSGRFWAHFEVSSVEVQASPVFEERMRFRLLSPLCISKQLEGEKYPKYLHPEEEGYGELLLQNLLHKQRAFQEVVAAEGASDPVQSFDFQVVSAVRSKLLHIKGVQVRGYLFDFEVDGDRGLLELGYAAGFGEKNSGLGMGMVEVHLE